MFWSGRLSRCCGFAVERSSLLSLYWSVRKCQHKDPVEKTTIQRSPGPLIVRRRLERAHSIQERPCPKTDKPHKEATTKQNNRRHNNEKEERLENEVIGTLRFPVIIYQCRKTEGQHFMEWINEGYKWVKEALIGAGNRGQNTLSIWTTVGWSEWRRVKGAC